MSLGSAFMQNKKIASLLKDAIDAPLGSTKREQAKAMVAVLKRAMAEHQGQGGPGYRYSPTSIGSQYILTKSPKKDPVYSDMSIHSTPPAPHHANPFAGGPQGQQQPGQMNQPQQPLMFSPLPAQSMPYSSMPVQSTPTPSAQPFDTYSADISMPSSSAAYANMGDNTQRAPTPYYGTMQPNFASPATISNGQGGPGDLSDNSMWTMPNTSSNLSSDLSVGSLAGIPQLKQPANTSLGDTGGLSLTPISSLGNVNPSSPAQQLSGTSAPTRTSPFQSYPNLSSNPYFTSSQPSQPAQTPAPTQTPTQTTPAATDTTGTGTGTQTDTSGTSTGTDTATGTGTGYTFDASNPYANVNANSAVVDAVKNNTGATGFADQAMNNPALLKEIFPDMQNIPSGTLTQAVGELQKTLDAKYNIQGLESQMSQMVANGVTLGPMLQTYIQNKDQSLQAIDQQRQKAQEMMLHTDSGNPYDAAIWSRYNDYLNTMYTAQNSSYADFFNKSVGMYNSALTALNTTMSNAINQYTNELNVDSQLTEADYNRIYQSLSDMYTAVQNAPQQQLEMATLQAQLAQAQGAVAGGVLGTGKGDWSAEYKNLAESGVVFTQGTGTGTGLDKSGAGELDPSITDLTGALNTILSDKPDVGLNGALYMVTQGMSRGITSNSGNPDKMIPMALNYRNMLAAAASNGTIPSTTADAINQTLMQQASKSITDYISSSANPKRSQAAKDAMKFALDGHSGFLGMGGYPTIQQFEQKYKGQLPTSLLDYMYNAAQLARQTVQKQYSGNASGANSFDSIMKQYVQQIDALQTPADIAKYVGDTVSSMLAGAGTTQ